MANKYIKILVVPKLSNKFWRYSNPSFLSSLIAWDYLMMFFKMRKMNITFLISVLFYCQNCKNDRSLIKISSNPNIISSCSWRSCKRDRSNIFLISHNDIDNDLSSDYFFRLISPLFYKLHFNPYQYS